QLVTASREVSEGEVGPAKILTETRRYDRNGRLVEVRRGDSPPETWTYDERGLAISRTLGAGTPEAATFTTHRDTAGHVVLAVDAEDSDGDGQAEVEERRYDGHGRLVAVIDPAGGTRLFERGVGGVVVSESFFGAPGGPAPEVPGSGNVLLERTGTEYDERGRMVRRTRELFGGKEARRRLVEEIYRDPEGRVVRRVGPGGEELTLLRDALGRVVGEQHPSGSRLEREYDPNGNVLVEIHSEVAAEIMDPGLADDPDYDEEGRLRRRSHLVHLHDALDRRVMTIDEDGGAWRARYDSRGNLIFLSDAEGTVITAAAEPEVLPVLDLLTDRMRNRLTGHGNRVRYVYDNLGRLISVGHEMRRRGAGGAPIDGTNPFDIDGTGTVSFEWSDANRLVGWTEDDGRRTRLVLDAVGHPVRKIWPDNSEEAWDVDRDGHPRRLIDRNGSVITQRFDALHRLVERRIEPGPGVQGTTRQLFEYDGLSRTTFLFDDNSPVDSTDDSRVSRRYDSLGRLVEECQDGFCFVREHDDEGRVVSLRYPDGRLLETPRAADGGIATLAVDGRAFAVYGRLSSGRLVEKTLGVGVRLSYIDTDERGIPRLLGFDRRGNVVRHEYSSDVGELIVGFEYGRNSWGLPLFERQLHVRRTPGDVWRYDSIYRVRLYIPDVFDPRVPPVNPLRKLEFIHDPSHNWRFVEVDQGRREVEVGLRNEFLLFDDEALEYDRRGNLTSFRNRSFVYDALDRLVRIVDGGSDVARYRYDADGANEPLDYAGSGRRVSKDVRQPAQNQPAGFTRFTYAGTLPAEERDARARIVRQYFHEDGGRTEVFLQHLDGLVPEPFVFLHNDAGSNVAVVDARGIVVESARYGLHGEPAVLNRFGNLVAFPGTANPRYFGGLVWDFESGFHAVGGRYFFPELGRYLTDAAPFILREPLAVNGYLRPGLAPFPGQVTGGGLPLARRAFLDAFRVRLEPPRSLLSPPAARGTLSSKIRQLLSLASSGGEK
ncbi:MAG: hypothetical protein O7J95_03600, partial [Planctomycetota bacterium]|nr:hypothetical protein [Planctomycetota bacterium]